MRKLNFFAILFAALLVSGGAWGVTRTANDLASLKDAIADAVTGDTIQLTGSIDGATTSATGALVSIDKAGVSFTLDLNGNHITGGYSGASAGTLLITAGEVTIIDSGTGGYLGTAGTSKYVVNIKSGAKVTLNSGAIYGASYLVNSYGEFTMNNGSIIAQSTEASCYATYNGGVANFYDGCVKATSSFSKYTPTIYAVSTGTSNRTSIFGGKFGSFGSKVTKDISNVSFVGGGKFVQSGDYSDGYVVNTISEEIDGVTYTKEVVPVSPATMVAEVGSTQYSSLAKAFLDAPDNSTIRLINPVSINSLGINSPEKKTLTLDLNNQSISDANHAQASSTTSGRIRIFGNLTITDESDEKGGTIFVNGKSANTHGLVIPAGGKLTIEKGNIIGQNPVAGKGIFLTYVNGGELQVNGGTMKVQTTTTGNAVVAQIGSAGNVTLNGGNFHIKADSPYGFGFIYGLKGKVRGGIFTCEGVTNTSYFVAGSEVTGGQFNFDPSTYIPVSDKMLKSDGTDKVSPFGTELTLQYSVVTNPNPTMMVKNVNTGVDYASPFEAISAANTGEELRLLEEMNIGEFSLMLNKPLTLDINGKALSSNTSTIVIASGDANDPVVITDKAQVKGSIIGQQSIVIDNIDGLNVTVSDVVLNGSINCIKNTSSEAMVNISNVKGTVTNMSSNTLNFSNSISILHSTKKAYITITNCDFLINCPNSATTSSGYSVSVIYYQNNLCSCTINGGTYKAISKTTQANIIKFMSGGAPITVYDGKFAIESQDVSKVAFYASGSSKATDKAKPSIQGGYYTMDPTAWVASTHGVVNNPQEEPNYAYKVVEQNAASVNGVNYGTVQEAVAAVEVDPTLGAITLLRNVTLSNTLEISSNITFAETSYTMTLNGNPSIIVQTGATMPSCIAAPMEASAPKEGKTYYYTSFYNAYSNNSAIKLEEDATYSNILRVNDGIKTIDLNGHTLSGNQSYSFIELKYWYDACVLNLINTAQNMGIVKNNSAVLNSHVIDIDKYSGMVYDGSYAKVVVGENVKLQGETGIEMWRDSTFLEVYGSIESTGFAISGNGSEEHWGTNIHIYEGANITSTGAPAIYHPQYGELVIDGGTISGSQSAVEVRSGDITINGGTFNATATNIACQPNASGTTTIGAAIAVSQHVTKNPINVTINGGTFTAPMAMIQVNPQNNTEAEYKTMIVNVNGGYFKSTNNIAGTLFENQENYGTVTYYADDIFISQNRRIFLRGGYFNYNPINFVATGFQSKKLEDIVVPSVEDLAAMDSGYVYKVGEIDPESEVTTTECVGCINWKNDAVELWDNGQVPTDATPVVIDGKEVEVTTPAYAYSVDLTNADKLTVKNGGMLMVGAGGVDGATSDNLIVEPGGMICVSPNAEEYAHPTGTVKVSSEYARRKNATADAKDLSALTEDDLYWKHMACPIKSGTLTLSQTGKTYINTWSLKNGWESKTITDMNTPFVGYNISTILRSDTRATDSVVFNFKGELIGNEVDYLKFANTGFTFFGNSYLAPIDIRELLTSLDVNENVESTVILYHYIEDDYEYVNRAMFAIPTTSAEVAPLEGFFIFSLESASVTYNYTKAVWDAFCAKARVVEGKTSAPARNQSMANNFDAMACVKVASANGKHDKVYLFEGTEFSSMFDNGYDARKMKSNGLQISAMDADKELAIIATNNLEGTALSLSTNDATQYTMSFSNVSGNTYAIYDALTAATVNITEGATYTFTADANSKLDNRFRVVEARQLPTNVAESKAPVAAKGVYTVLGEYLGEGNNWMSLPSGVYIVNGEKMVR